MRANQSRVFPDESAITCITSERRNIAWWVGNFRKANFACRSHREEGKPFDTALELEIELRCLLPIDIQTSLASFYRKQLSK